MSRSLGRYAALVGRPLEAALHAITGKDREALLAGRTTQGPMNFQTVDRRSRSTPVGTPSCSSRCTRSSVGASPVARPLPQ